MPCISAVAKAVATAHATHMTEHLDEATVRDRLLRELAEVEALDKASEEDRDTVEFDQTTVGRLSRMNEIQGQAMAVEAHRRRETRIARIRSALARLDAGEYGICVACGEEIDARRLAADLSTPTCVTCAASGRHR